MKALPGGRVFPLTGRVASGRAGLQFPHAKLARDRPSGSTSGAGASSDAVKFLGAGVDHGRKQ